MGQPGPPGAGAVPAPRRGGRRRPTRICLGPLVARVGLVPDDVAGGRARRPGPHGPGPADRRAGHRRPAERGRERGLRDPVRAGRRTPAGPGRLRPRVARASACPSGSAAVGATTELAVDLGRRGGAVNLWAGQPSAVAAQAARCEVTWAGPVAGWRSPRDRALARRAGRGRGHLGRLRAGRSPLRGGGRGGRAADRDRALRRRSRERRAAPAVPFLDGVPPDQRAAARTSSRTSTR